MTQRAFGQPFNANDFTVRLAVKTGVTLFPADGADAQALVRNAEVALRHAKKTGERLVSYDRIFTERTAERLTLEHRLMLGLERNEFVRR